MSTLTPEEILAVAVDFHEQWMSDLQAEGVCSRPAPWGDEELMAPLMRLSQRAKDYNAKSVVNMLKVLKAAGYVPVPEMTLKRMQMSLKDMISGESGE